jgi:hypothetical protein
MQEGDFYKIRVPVAPEIRFSDVPQDASKEPPRMRTRDILVRIEAFQGRAAVVVSCHDEGRTRLLRVDPGMLRSL